MNLNVSMWIHLTRFVYLFCLIKGQQRSKSMNFVNMCNSKIKAWMSFILVFRSGSCYGTIPCLDSPYCV